MIQHFSLIFFLLCFYNATFFLSGNIIKPPQPSSAFYRALILNTDIGHVGHMNSLSHSITTKLFILQVYTNNLNNLLNLHIYNMTTQYRNFRQDFYGFNHHQRKLQLQEPNTCYGTQKWQGVWLMY